MTNKIYFTCLHLNHGGVEMAISLLSNALCKRGYEVEILCTYHFGKPAYYIDPKVKITYLTNVLPNRTKFQAALKSKNIFSIIKEGFHAIKVLYYKKTKLKKALQRIEEGIVISTRHEDSLLLSKYGAPQLIKIAQLHHDHHFDQKLFRDFKHSYSNIDYFVLLTDTLRDEIQEAMSPYNGKTKCVTIPNFLPLDKNTTRQPKQKQVIAVGRLHTDKAFHRLIEAWHLVNKQHPDWILKIVGDGPLKEDLSSQVSNLNLQDCVILTGALSHDKVMAEMATSSIYAMTSISEAFPFVLMEAMYNYLPVVAYDVRVGPRALVKHEQTGFLVPDNDTIAFSDALCKIMTSPELSNQLQEEAFAFVQNFTEETVIDQWIQLMN